MSYLGVMVYLTFFEHLFHPKEHFRASVKVLTLILDRKTQHVLNLMVFEPIQVPALSQQGKWPGCENTLCSNAWGVQTVQGGRCNTLSENANPQGVVAPPNPCTLGHLGEMIRVVIEIFYKVGKLRRLTPKPYTSVHCSFSFLFCFL